MDELLDHVDVVHNCTPNDVHASVTEAALGADIHVLSEKPLGLDATEAARLARAAGEASVVTGVCFNYRHLPLVQEMRSLVAQGGDGPVHLVHGAYLQDWLLRQDDWNWRLVSSRAGASRATNDIGSHWIDLMQHVTGDVVASVSARLGRLFDERTSRRRGGPADVLRRGDGGGTPMTVDTEDMAVVLFRREAGVRSVTISQVSAGWKNHLVLEVDAGETSLVWDQEDRTTSGSAGVTARTEMSFAILSQLRPAPHGSRTSRPGIRKVADTLRNMFHRLLRRRERRTARRVYEPTFASFADAARVQATVEAVVRSDTTAAGRSTWTTSLGGIGMKLGVFTGCIATCRSSEILDKVVELGSRGRARYGNYPGDAHCKPDELLGDPKKAKAYRGGHHVTRPS